MSSNRQQPPSLSLSSTTELRPTALHAFSALCNRAARAIAARAIDIAYTATFELPDIASRRLKQIAKNRKKKNFARDFWAQAQSAHGFAELLAHPQWSRSQALDASCELALVFDELIRHPQNDDPRRALCLALLDPRNYPAKDAIDMASASLGWLAHLAANHATGIYDFKGQDGEPIAIDMNVFDNLASSYFAVCLPGLSAHMERDPQAFSREDFAYFFSKAVEHWERAELICENSPPALIAAMHRLAQEREPYRITPLEFSSLIERTLIGHEAGAPTPGKPGASRSL